MPEFRLKTLKAWQIPLVTVVVFVLLFLSEVGLGVPKMDTGAVYMLGGIFLFAMILTFFKNRWDAATLVILDERGIEFRSGCPGALGSAQNRSLAWNEVTRIGLTYVAPSASFVTKAIIERLFRGLPPNIIIYSGKGIISLPAGYFTRENYAQIMELLKKYAGEKIGKD